MSVTICDVIPMHSVFYHLKVVWYNNNNGNLDFQIHYWDSGRNAWKEPVTYRTELPLTTDLELVMAATNRIVDIHLDEDLTQVDKVSQLELLSWISLDNFEYKLPQLTV